MSSLMQTEKEISRTTGSLYRMVRTGAGPRGVFSAALRVCTCVRVCAACVSPRPHQCAPGPGTASASCTDCRRKRAVLLNKHSPVREQETVPSETREEVRTSGARARWRHTRSGCPPLPARTRRLCSRLPSARLPAWLAEGWPSVTTRRRA